MTLEQFIKRQEKLGYPDVPARTAILCEGGLADKTEVLTDWYKALVTEGTISGEDEADINHAKQNHPELVVQDLAEYVEAPVVRRILKQRGINKWLRIRRLLIQQKDLWKREIECYEQYKRMLKALRAEAYGQHNMPEYQKHTKDFFYLKGYVEALKDVRQQVRTLCHSNRDIDFPEKAGDYGEVCELPADMPLRPSKGWLRAKDKERSR